MANAPTGAARRTLKLRGRLIDLAEPRIMAIANFTPDSFYAASRGRVPDCSAALLLDVGGYSTRPGADEVSEEEELHRLGEGLSATAPLARAGTFISVDTFRPSVLRALAGDYTIDMANDVSGGSDEMFATVAEMGLAYVLTYPEGGYSPDMLLYFSRRLDQLGRLGVTDVVLDPGFGFGKTAAQNWEIARNLHVLRELGLPVLAGVSRKSMLRDLLGVDAEHALNGTTALNALLLAKGVDLLRVHDPEEARQTLLIYQQTRCHAPVH